MELYLQSPIYLHGIVLNYWSTGTALPSIKTIDTIEYSSDILYVRFLTYTVCSSVSLVLLSLLELGLIAFSALKNFPLPLKSLEHLAMPDVSSYSVSRGTYQLCRVETIHCRFGGITHSYFLPFIYTRSVQTTARGPDTTRKSFLSDLRSYRENVSVIFFFIYINIF
jgi:hypothetical protein